VGRIARVIDEMRGTVHITWMGTDPILWVASWQVEGESAPRDGSEHATPDEAVRWGRERCARVVIIGRDGQAYWAGNDPVPGDVSATWNDAPPHAR
jgi:hypothetical protein